MDDEFQCLETFAPFEDYGIGDAQVADLPCGLR